MLLGFPMVKAAPPLILECFCAIPNWLTFFDINLFLFLFLSIPALSLSISLFLCVNPHNPSNLHDQIQIYLVSILLRKSIHYPPKTIHGFMHSHCSHTNKQKNVFIYLKILWFVFHSKVKNLLKQKNILIRSTKCLPQLTYYSFCKILYLLMNRCCWCINGISPSRLAQITPWYLHFPLRTLQ